LWRQVRDQLAAVGNASPVLDAKLLAQHALGLGALELATRENEMVSADGADTLARLVERRLTGESVARIIGEREFYGLPFRLNEATLEPRPETELLVEMAIAGLPERGHLLDLGTGSGCIPIAVLANRHDANATAVDLSSRALGAARENAERNRVNERLNLREGSWFEPLPENGRFAVIVSNPPYIASSVVDTLTSEVRDFDPRLALDGGPDGLAPYRVIAAAAGAFLLPEGKLLLEIGYDQGVTVSQLLVDSGFVEVAIHQDLNGLDRVVSATI
jgi:release factor glutamine methyltransferase